MSREIRLRRTFLRAPLGGKVIFTDQGSCLSANILNISIGGILLESLPRFPKDQELFIMFTLPKLVELSMLGDKDIFTLDKNDFHFEIIRSKAMVVRGEDDVDDLDMIFRCVGMELIDLKGEFSLLIEDYVTVLSRNINYLLRLFNEDPNSDSNNNLIRKIAELLGYNPNQKLAIIRKDVAKDFTGLESL